MNKLIIGTRGSKLALWQAHFVQDQLKAIGVESELEIIKTKGDAIQHLSFDKIEGKGFFTKEIEDALLEGRVDLAVHSMKDLPTTQPKGLSIAAVSYRENPSDWLVIRKDRVDEAKVIKLPENAIVGTSSARRKALLLDARNDITLKDIRGNVPTRLQKLRDGNFDAIVLAAAGLVRLEMDMSDFVVVELHPTEFVPAPAQGVLALQIREEDVVTRRILRKMHHNKVSRCTNVERRVLQLADGGCHLPLGVYCHRDNAGNYNVSAIFADAWDAPLRRVSMVSGTHAGLAQQIFDALQQ